MGTEAAGDVMSSAWFGCCCFAMDHVSAAALVALGPGAVGGCSSRSNSTKGSSRNHGSMVTAAAAGVAAEMRQ